MAAGFLVGQERLAVRDDRHCAAIEDTAQQAALRPVQRGAVILRHGWSFILSGRGCRRGGDTIRPQGLAISLLPMPTLIHHLLQFGREMLDPRIVLHQNDARRDGMVGCKIQRVLSHHHQGGGQRIGLHGRISQD